MSRVPSAKEMAAFWASYLHYPPCWEAADWADWSPARKRSGLLAEADFWPSAEDIGATGRLIKARMARCAQEQCLLSSTRDNS